jgi:hypothetical protein
MAVSREHRLEAAGREDGKRCGVRYSEDECSLLKKRCTTDAAYKNQKPRTSFPKSEELGWTPGSSAFLFRLSKST